MSQVQVADFSQSAMMADEFNLPMFDEDEYRAWTNEWRDMPEFVQEEQRPYAQIVFRFVNAEDLQAFAKLIGQPLTRRTRSAWHPPLQRGANGRKRWVTEP